MPESTNANAIEATVAILGIRLPENGFVISASCSIHVNINCMGREPCEKIPALFGKRPAPSPLGRGVARTARRAPVVLRAAMHAPAFRLLGGVAARQRPFVERLA